MEISPCVGLRRLGVLGLRAVTRLGAGLLSFSVMVTLSIVMFLCMPSAARGSSFDASVSSPPRAESTRIQSSQRRSHGVVDHDRPGSTERANAMGLASGHDGRLTRVQPVGATRERDLELAFQEVPYLFLGVIMDVHG